MSRSARGQLLSRSTGLCLPLDSQVSDVKEAAQKQQRDLSRELEPVISTKMAPGYTAATAEAGTGSHRRRVDILERHVRASAPAMFKEAVGGVVDKLDEIRSSIGKKLEADVVVATLGSLATAYTPLWDEVGQEARAVRQRLAPQVRSILLEAANAVRRLQGDNGGGVAGGSGGTAADAAEEDDLVDVTAAARAEKRARQEAAAIDLEELDENEPLQVAGANQPHAAQRPKVAGSNNAEASGSGSAHAFVPKGE